MKVYMIFRVVNGLNGYDCCMDIADMKNLSLGWITAGQLGMFLQSYQDYDADIYIKFPDTHDYILIPKTEG